MSGKTKLIDAQLNYEAEQITNERLDRLNGMFRDVASFATFGDWLFDPSQVERKLDQEPEFLEAQFATEHLIAQLDCSVREAARIAALRVQISDSCKADDKKEFDR